MERRKHVVGTAGHIDHGKTALVRALTGVDGDRLPEEKRRGITIDLGFASWFTEQDQVGFVDVPGHERFVRNMLAGAGGIDAALLVVAADESIKPQTREHFAICRLLGIGTGVIALTKCDLVEPDIVELVRLEVEEMVSGSFLEGKAIVPVSSVTMEGIDALRAALIDVLAGLPERDFSSRVFRLPIDRAFTMKGFGSVVTGTAYSGQLRIDQEVEILPLGVMSRARNIQVHGQPRDHAVAGERTSVNLADVALESLHRGEQIVEPGTLRPSQIITARLDLLPDAKALKEQTRVRFHHLASELLGSVRIIDSTEGEIRPGTSAYVQLRLESPVVAVAGDRFVIRRYSPACTIGGGVIVDAHMTKLSRRTRSEMLETLHRGTLPERVELMTKAAGVRGLALSEVQMRTGLRTAALETALPAKSVPRLTRVTGSSERQWIHSDVLADFRKRAMVFLDAWFQANKLAVAVAKSEFVQKLFPDQLDPAIITFLLADLEKEKIIILAGDSVEVPGRSKKLAGSEGVLAATIEQRFLEAGLLIPPVSELINTIHQKPKVIEGVVAFLVKQGVLLRLAEGIYLHRDTIATARQKLQERCGQTIDVAAFKELFGISRKVAIPLLEFFDREGSTKRLGDARLVLPARA